MAKLILKGTTRANEIRVDKLRPDTRTVLTKIYADLGTTEGVTIAMIAIVSVTLLFLMVPMMVEFALSWMFIIYFFWVRNEKKKWDFPFRVPKHANIFDGSHDGFKKGVANFYFGIELSTRLEVWGDKVDIGTHLLVIGTTGSGKTEALLGLAFNALVHLSSFAFIDGKGDPKLWENVTRIAIILNRQIDLLMLSFLTGGVNYAERQETKVTNTCAPYSSGSGAVISELQIAQMDDSGGKGDMWKGRAISFIQALNHPLVYQRDLGHILLNPNAYIPYFDLPTLENFAMEFKALDISGSEISYANDAMFKILIKPLSTFVTTLPGYQENKRGEQEQKTLEQFGFITMQLTRLWNDMSYTYGHIYGTGLGEIYMYDVVLNRRILVGAIPSLERSTETLSMLGKMVIGQIKQMMGGSLGNRVEGITRVIIDSRPTNANFPFQVILDEYGYYICVGFACAVAQSRSLGFSITIATQDLASLKKGSPEEADATWENTNIRMIGRITSGKESETWRKIIGLVDQATVEVTGGKEFSAGDFKDSYYSNRDTHIDKVDRVTYGDIAAQSQGEFTTLVGKKFSDGTQGVAVIRVATFYTETKRVPSIRLNHFLAVNPPSISEINRAKGARAISKALSKMIIDGTWVKALPDSQGEKAAGLEYPPDSSSARIMMIKNGIELAKKSPELLSNVSSCSEAFAATYLSIFAVARIKQMKEHNQIQELNSLEAARKNKQVGASAPTTVTKKEIPEQISVNSGTNSLSNNEAGFASKVDFTAVIDDANHKSIVSGEDSPVKNDDIKVSNIGGKELEPEITKQTEVSEIPVPRVIGTSTSDAIVKLKVQEYFAQKKLVRAPVSFDDIDQAEVEFEPVNISRMAGSSLSKEGGIEKITKAVECMMMTSAYGVGSGMLEIKNATNELVDSIDQASAYYRGTVPEPEPKDVFKAALQRIKAVISDTEDVE
ncbi:TraM recognition domain-containing protein [Iodobacter sp. CM08]|uniref:TraM recognition domain-containing protein n=1 Tax=Iodobacter sp. CM08 TaxID=3085902 RepID=UPI002980C84D|nr:TraM recognition domain-containing protein [Iodobacter sp. CM08]MDW5418619.1 TraM recognition domain-containing protein [Iodobacter sp. CM08]